MHLALLAASFDPGYLVDQLTLGLSIGAIYALIALGYTMVYGIVELINFAHGDVFTVGGFVALSITGVVGTAIFRGPLLIPALVVLLLVTMIINGVLGVVIERVAYRRLRNAPRLAPLITAVGVSFLLEGIMFVIEGPNNHRFPEFIPGQRLPIPGINLNLKEVVVIVIAVALMLALQAFITRSKLGRAMRATAQDRDAARLMGINIDRTIATTFFIGSALAGAGGVIYGLYYNNLQYNLGFQAGIIAFTAAVFGGIGNITGAAVGGFAIGIIYALSSGYISQQWSDVVIFSVLIIVLVFKPTGLLGTRVTEKA
ncbi:MAG: branched-chain amino acid ABC transporter permease [Candidatus Dormibacteria bacterium]